MVELKVNFRGEEERLFQDKRRRKVFINQN